jgi:hypothetical protein
MTYEDHAAFIEVKGRLQELRALQSDAREALDLSQLQAQIDAAEAEQVEIMRRTHPEDVPKL